MNPNTFKPRYVPGHPQPTEMVEWEELPSLADSLSRRLIVRDWRGEPHADFQNSSVLSSIWDNTMPAALEPMFEQEPFSETIGGLATRELREPDVFRYFFA